MSSQERIESLVKMMVMIEKLPDRELNYIDAWLNGWAARKEYDSAISSQVAASA